MSSQLDCNSRPVCRTKFKLILSCLCLVCRSLRQEIEDLAGVMEIKNKARTADLAGRITYVCLIYFIIRALVTVGWILCDCSIY